MTKHGIYFNAILPGYVISHGTDYDKGTEEAERKRLNDSDTKIRHPDRDGVCNSLLAFTKKSFSDGRFYRGLYGRFAAIT